jgi:hypothetical protein
MENGMRLLVAGLTGLLLPLLCALAPAARAAGSDKIVLGAVEEIIVQLPAFPVVARVDTGAATSSLDARDIKVHGPRGARKVHFTLVSDGGRRATLDLPLEDYHSVVTPDKRPERRPTVLLEICVAGMRIPAEFTLNDRSHLEYRALLGRNVLAGRFVVDVERTHIVPSSCPSPR